MMEIKKKRDMREELFHIEELGEACRTDNGDLEKVKRLVTKDNVNMKDDEGCPPLIYASYNNSIEVVRYFLKRADELGLDVNNKNIETPLEHACYCQLPEVLKLLLLDKNIKIRENVSEETGDECRSLLKEFQKDPQEYRNKYSHLVFGKKKKKKNALERWLEYSKNALKNTTLTDVVIKVVDLEKPQSSL